MDETPSPQSLVPELRKRVRDHNRHVLIVTGMTVGASIILWGLLYAGSAWATLLVATVVLEANGQEGYMPPLFHPVFLLVAALLLIAALVRRALVRNEAARDYRRWTEHALDVILAIPATTVAIWGNLSAWLWFDKKEFREAAGLLERVLQSPERKLPVISIPQEIPDDSRRERILTGLLLAGVLDLRQEKGVPYVRPAMDSVQELGALPPNTDALPARAERRRTWSRPRRR